MLYGVIALITTFFTMIFVPMMHTTMLTSSKIRPSVIQNGSNVVTLPLQPTFYNNLSSKVAFGPNGTGYFIESSGAIEEVSPSGRYASIPDPHVLGTLTDSIIYAHGKLWATADYGIVSVAPNGGSHRLYNLVRSGKQFFAVGVADGKDGYVYALINYSDAQGIEHWLYRISQQGAVTGSQLQNYTTAATDTGFIRGAGGDFYTTNTYTYPLQGQGIARIRFDGSVAFFTTGNSNSNVYDPIAPAYSNGNVYFLVSSVAYINERDVYTWYLDRLSAGGISVIKTFAPGEVASGLAIDFGGNVWVTTSKVPLGSSSLYQYNVVTGGYGGPFLSSANWSGPIAVGSDDNIWLPTSSVIMVGPTSDCCFFSGFSVFVRHVQTLEPTSIAIQPMHPAQFTMLETHSNGPWTAVSQQPSIAAVSPAVSTTGVFTVNELHSGSAQILVSDKLGNFSYETVTAQ